MRKSVASGIVITVLAVVGFSFVPNLTETSWPTWIAIIGFFCEGAWVTAVTLLLVRQGNDGYHRIAGRVMFLLGTPLGTWGMFNIYFHSRAAVHIGTSIDPLDYILLLFLPMGTCLATWLIFYQKTRPPRRKPVQAMNLGGRKLHRP